MIRRVILKLSGRLSFLRRFLYKKTRQKIAKAVLEFNEQKKPVLLNLGCGHRYSDGWINIDMNSNSPSVYPYNFLKGIPMQDKSADAIYSSHCLEHLAPDMARVFLKECLRVLRGGYYVSLCRIWNWQLRITSRLLLITVKIMNLRMPNYAISG